VSNFDFMMLSIFLWTCVAKFGIDFVEAIRERAWFMIALNFLAALGVMGWAIEMWKLS